MGNWLVRRPGRFLRAYKAFPQQQVPVEVHGDPARAQGQQGQKSIELIFGLRPGHLAQHPRSRKLHITERQLLRFKDRDRNDCKIGTKGRFL